MSASSTAVATAGVINLSAPANFPLVVTPEIRSAISPRVESFNIQTITPTEITKLGFDAEMELTRALDSFLATVDRAEAPVVFGLIDQLAKAVSDERLEDLAERVMKGTPLPFTQRIMSLFSPSSARTAVNRAMAETSRIVSLKSKKLVDVVDSLQKQTQDELVKLQQDMVKLDVLLSDYTVCHNHFAHEVLFLHNALEVARAQVAALNEENSDQLERSQVAQKLQALESRALAIEGAMTKLPADQLTFAQLQDAGLSTIQEMTTTMSVRFPSIKSNLLAIHAAHRVIEGQRLAEKGMQLDENSAKVRNKLMKQAVTTAANAPGDNRLRQAQQIQSFIQTTRELVDINNQARTTNQSKFGQARGLLSDSRMAMLDLGKTVANNRQVR